MQPARLIIPEKKARRQLNPGEIRLTSTPGNDKNFQMPLRRRRDGGKG
jgi:hypothetical protein